MASDYTGHSGVYSQIHNLLSYQFILLRKYRFFQLSFLASCAGTWRVNRVHGDQPPHTSPGHGHTPGTSTGHGHPPGTSQGHGHPARMGPSSWDVGTRGAPPSHGRLFSPASRPTRSARLHCCLSCCRSDGCTVELELHGELEEALVFLTFSHAAFLECWCQSSFRWRCLTTRAVLASSQPTMS